jgi:hypothetical protein
MSGEQAISAGPYSRVFGLRGPITERDHVHICASGGSAGALPDPRLGRRALGGIALGFPSLLS